MFGGNLIFEVKEKILNLVSSEFFNFMEADISLTEDEKNLINLSLRNIKLDYNCDITLTENLKNDIQNLPYSLDTCKEDLKKLYKHKKFVNYLGF